MANCVNMAWGVYIRMCKQGFIGYVYCLVSFAFFNKSNNCLKFEQIKQNGTP